MNLVNELNQFDGKHTEVLARLASRLGGTADAIGELISLVNMGDTRLDTAATWVLKRFQEESASFSTEHISLLLDLLIEVPHWEARLHLLQMLDGLTIPASHKSKLWRAMEANRNDANKFVRAWSYNGMAVLASQFPSLRKKAIERFENVPEQEAASVKARIRNIRKNTPWAKPAK